MIQTLTIISIIISCISMLTVVFLILMIVQRERQTKILDNTLDYIVKHL